MKKTTTKEKIEKIMDASEVALVQLEKLIRQDIDLNELDPEKAKQAAQGKIEAIQGSIDIIKKLDDLKLLAEDLDPDAANKKVEFFGGVEKRIK